MYKDRYDLELTTHSEKARDAYVAGIDGLLAATPDPAARLHESLQEDPGFALAHAALARDHQLAGRMKEAREGIEQAVECVASATERERQHVEILRLIIFGQAEDALSLTRRHIQDYPLDAFALAPSCSVFGLIGFSGRTGREEEQRLLLEPLVDIYGDDWWFHSAWAFALLEVGEWEKATALVQRSLEQSPRNAHAAHTYAHCLYESGSDADARAYLEDWLPDHPREGLLHCHLWWHLALVRLVEGDVDGMWQAFDDNVSPGATDCPAINVMSDAAALLWRAELAGQQRSLDRWRKVAAFKQEAFPKPIVFIDAHGGLPAAALGDAPGVQEHIDQVLDFAAKGRLPAGTVAADLTTAFNAYANAEWGKTIATLEPVMDEVVRIGGSRAQRDLVTCTLLSAYIKDGRQADAASLVEAVHDRQPTILGMITA